MELNAARIERVFGIPQRNWKKILKANLERGAAAERDSLALCGYPELHQVSFYLTTDSLPLWKSEGAVLLPRACCVCERTPSVWLPTEESDGEFHNGRRPAQLTSVPHCSDHGSDEYAKLLFDGGSLSATVVWVALLGANAKFLRDARMLNTQGDVPPPWIAFPDQNSYSGFWRQSGEPWIAAVFRPFWAALDAPRKSEYLDRWSAPGDWREWLSLWESD